MASLNRAELVGRLTRDTEVRYTPAGVPVARFTIATNRYSGTGEERRELTDFIPVVAWAKLAETIGEHCGKGRLVLVEGRVQSRAWETEDGQKRSTIEIVAGRVQFLSRQDSRELVAEAAMAAQEAEPDEVPV